ncbi:UDP-N-acetylmuramoyl-tripeptide--D-alanyl-D-alanine ligase [Photobacterium angustum]|uniref:UDP-N-acetylmuramoyl-tripeptide--D-alanyl-D-alanine ligase n=1 Tax=Photobacterium angustum TaxID=661 RepID=A0A2S7W1I0_PHOAN|nr:UDP-N-acetylmuramoyl-tripeptide--D-alanyl-D-alanine ligase [Photobacterium angustum]PQJ67928.1 UDP-N-acetylmuramoyl-tripeptide--D-alanyl-D-alanine ligase [Photobacterium angustum]
MIDVQLSQLASVLNAELIGADVSIAAVSTDTRNIPSETLFIALKGERFDAHDFCQTAKENGAKALLVSKPLPVELPQLVVSDTRIALGMMGAWLKAQMTEKYGLQTVALTGSCGKTTVKEMSAAILANKGQVLATAGNFNNDIGAPLTLLRLTPEYQYAVIELGANHQNEISYTTNLVKPNVALINNIAAAHLEGFGSLQGVAKAKGEIFEGLVQNGTAIINLESNDLALWQPLLAEHQVLTFSTDSHQADYFAEKIKITTQGLACFTMCTPIGKIDINLALAGMHNVSNALAAAALTVSLGAKLADVKAGLETMANVKGRLDITEPLAGLRLIDDTYNASVAAVKAAIDVLASFEGKRYFIFGDMAELGEESDNLHREVGEYALEKQLDCVMTFGHSSAVVSECNQGQHFSDKGALIMSLKQQLQQYSRQPDAETVTVLVKGARSSKMEDVIAALQEDK